MAVQLRRLQPFTHIQCLVSVDFFRCIRFSLQNGKTSSLYREDVFLMSGRLYIGNSVDALSDLQGIGEHYLIQATYSLSTSQSISLTGYILCYPNYIDCVSVSDENAYQINYTWYGEFHLHTTGSLPTGTTLYYISSNALYYTVTNTTTSTLPNSVALTALDLKGETVTMAYYTDSSTSTLSSFTVSTVQAATPVISYTYY